MQKQRNVSSCNNKGTFVGEGMRETCATANIFGIYFSRHVKFKTEKKIETQFLIKNSWK